MRTFEWRGQTFGGVARDHWRRCNERLDPEVDFVEIYRNVTQREFPWDTMQALSMALFRTFAVPEMGRLLDGTGQFTQRSQRRYDDTALLLEAPARMGFDHAEGRAAIRRINQMHRSYDIPDHQMRYVLSTFVVVPKHWLDRYGKRPLTEVELRASVNYYRTLGRRMAIPDIPPTYEEFERLMDSYEAEHFAFDPGGRRVADATLELMTTFYPRGIAPLVDATSRAVMDRPLLDALGYRPPASALTRATHAFLTWRGKALRLFPARRSAALVADHRRIRSYPGGFAVEELGTCPHVDRTGGVMTGPGTS